MDHSPAGQTAEPAPIAQRVQAALRSDPKKRAIEFNGAWLRWGEIRRLAERIDALLGQYRPGAQRAGLVARNRPGLVAAFAGGLAADRTMVMIYAAQSNDSIARDIEALRLPVIIADAQDWTPRTIAAAQRAGSLGLALTGNPDAPVPCALAFATAAAPCMPAAPSPVVMELLSSGTTGSPKRVPLLRTTFAGAVQDAAQVYAAGQGARPDAPNVVFHPLGNIAGVTFLIPFLVEARPIALLEKFEIEAWLDAVRRHRPARTSLPPAALRMILDRHVPPADLASLQAIGVGAAALDPLLQEAFEAEYGIPLLAGYGATEFCGVVANWTLPLYRAHGAAKRGSVGQARPGVALRIVDPAHFNPLPAGSVGLLEAQLERIGPHWIRTTDQAMLDEDGFLYLRGRADNVINRGGFKVMPEAIAQALRAHPAVADAVVIAMPDQRLGDVPVAAVELRPGAAAPTEAGLLQFARETLLSYEVPARIKLLDALPRNPSMKVILPAIRALFEQQEGGGDGG